MPWIGAGTGWLRLAMGQAQTTFVPMQRHLGAALVLILGTCEPERALAPTPSEAALAASRMDMVREQLVARGLKDPRILAAMGRVPRHVFVPEASRNRAYEDVALPIGYGQTISQPFIVALMTLAVDPRPGDRVLEVGTGSGYQAAVLAGLVAEVYSVEIVESLALAQRRSCSARAAPASMFALGTAISAGRRPLPSTPSS